jgi:hypothetical protein
MECLALGSETLLFLSWHRRASKAMLDAAIQVTITDEGSRDPLITEAEVLCRISGE